MKILRENWFKLGVIAILIGGFYWYALRPTQIQRYCSEQARIISPIISDLHLYKEYDMLERDSMSGLFEKDFNAWKHFYDICEAEYPNDISQ